MKERENKARYYDKRPRQKWSWLMWHGEKKTKKQKTQVKMYLGFQLKQRDNSIIADHVLEFRTYL